MRKLANLNYLTVSLFVLASVFTANAHAENVLKTQIPATAALVTSQEKGIELQLEVRQMPLTKVLDAIVKKTNVPIHYSVLPEGLITATCVGTSLKPVLECLLNRKADIIVRYLRGKTGNANNEQIAEAWILGSKLEAVTNSALCKVDSGQGSISLNHTDQIADPDPESESTTKPDQTDHLLKIAQSGKPKDRADAIGDLLSIGRQNDPKVKSMLEEAVHDQDANVRAQAVSTLTHRDDYRENAAQVIQEALQDSSVDVRMMAVDGITDEVGLLQQAVNDSDEVIRTLATSKLEDLMKMQRNKSSQ